jgi:hypothetical protein
METPTDGKEVLEPVVMLNLMNNTLKLHGPPIQGTLKEILETLKALSSGHQKASWEGKEVLAQLTRRVVRQFGDSGHLPVS